MKAGAASHAHQERAALNWRAHSDRPTPGLWTRKQHTSACASHAPGSTRTWSPGRSVAVGTVRNSTVLALAPACGFAAAAPGAAPGSSTRREVAGMREARAVRSEAALTCAVGGAAWFCAVTPRRRLVLRQTGGMMYAKRWTCTCTQTSTHTCKQAYWDAHKHTQMAHARA